MRLSKSCLYGIWATIYLASVSEREYIPIREISENLDIPFHFLTKILQALARAGIVLSLRGANGGVALADKPEKIYLKDVIIAIDGAGTFSDCVLGISKCDANNPCPIHIRWNPIKKQLDELVVKTSLSILADSARKTKWLNDPISNNKKLPMDNENLFIM